MFFRRFVTGQRSLLVLNCIIRSSNDSKVTSVANNTISRQMASLNEPQSEFTASFVTTPDEPTAKKIAQSLIEKKLAACVNIVPKITSIYEWEGKVNEDSEVLMIIKTTIAKSEQMIQFVRENHPYSVAEVISMPIVKGNQPYLDWIRKSVV